MSIVDTYLTIKKETEGFYKEKGSKFLAYAYPVNSEDEIKEIIQELKKKYYDARHHCYAYIIGPYGEKYRANDDGEPGHSAGDPILGQIRSNNLTDTLVVVVRYFGGTKLGVSGLINAYKTASADAIAKNEILEKYITSEIEIRYTYEDTNQVMKLIKDYELEIVSQEFTEQCIMQLRVRLKYESVVREMFSEMHNVLLRRS